MTVLMKMSPEVDVKHLFSSDPHDNGLNLDAGLVCFDGALTFVSLYIHGGSSSVSVLKILVRLFANLDDHDIHDEGDDSKYEDDCPEHQCFLLFIWRVWFGSAIVLPQCAHSHR